MENKQINTQDWDQMARYLAGEMSEQEINDFEKWSDAEDARKELLGESSAAFAMAQQFAPKKKLDADRAWNKLSDRIATDEEKVLRIPRPLYITYASRVAAVLVLALLLGFLVVRFSRGHNQQLIASTLGNEQKDINLPDQSIVSLNKDSKIVFTNQEDQKKRAVKLDGEAFFKVKRDVSRPFVVSTEGAEVRVLGTSFNVNSRPRKGNIEVCVKTGKVRVSNKSGQFVDLLPNEKVVLIGNKLVKERMINENYLAWKSKKLVFNNQPKLIEVIDLVNEVYHSNIELSDELKGIILGNTTFDQYSIDQVLDLLCTSFDLKKEKKDKNIILSKK